MTELLKIEWNEEENPDRIVQKLLTNPVIRQASELIKNNSIVGFPTETVYGLGASIYSSEAIKMIYAVKGRPQDNPIIVHISNFSMLKELVKEIPHNVKKLCKEFWPGPFTLLFPKSDKILDIVTAGLSTVAIRMPSHPVARALIEVAGVPIAAPSANISGKPSPTQAHHVYNDLKGKIPLIIDGGPCEVGVESTVIDINRDPPMILRPGGVSYEELRKIIPNIQIYEKTVRDEELEKNPSTPGLKYRHYAPNAKVILIEGSISEIESALHSNIQKLNEDKLTLGLIHTQNDIKLPPSISQDSSITIISLVIPEIDNEEKQNEVIAKEIFSALRELDEKKVDVIIIEGINEKYRGLAVMNRLRKAALRKS